MTPKKIRDEPINVTVDQYLMLCQEQISKEEYLSFEKQRVSNNWVNLIKKQNLKCYYCKTDIRIIQQLIIHKIIKPRKRGRTGYSGMHFEIDHKNADKKNNKEENLVAACYYCNNDKSNTFTNDIFKKYFGQFKNQSFKKLFEDKKLIKTVFFRHNLKGKSHS